MRDGVTMRDPSTVYLDWDVTLAADVTLEPNVILRGATSVGEGTVIGAGSQLIDSTIGAQRPRLGVASSSRRRSRTRPTIGPFSHLRPGSVVGRGAEVGNFAELKNTRLGAGLKQHHMSYLGDAEVGEGANIGAGHDHRQLRRHEQAPHDDRRRRVHRRRHDDRRPARHRRRAPGPVPAPSSRRTCRRASSRSASRRGSASPARNPRRTGAGTTASSPSEPAAGDAPRERAVVEIA